ncbi:MAG: 3-deoxy-D-manno-octulosonic acid transferase [Bacteroidia bacterium]|nr:3-deoxy-D-manno-octulosonic acid transferase [Bacteroidia bacterium]
MRFFYTFFIQFYSLGIRVAALFNHKASLWVMGRKDWKNKLSLINFSTKKVYWFHCASVGEFEQARPIIETFKKQNEIAILLSFYSPSGYELRKNYSYADWVIYLPIDTPSNAGYLIQHVKPRAVFFIKYEFWFNYLHQLKLRHIPVFLISGIFRPNHYFFKWYGLWMKNQLSAFTHFFVQNNESKELLSNIGYQQVTISGDTRFDRVLEIKNQLKTFKNVDAFVQNSKVLVAGSTYHNDEIIIRKAFSEFIKESENIKLIIAPHEVSTHRINEVLNTFGVHDSVRYSQLDNNFNNKKILIIDNIGMLSSLYGYAHFAYIGGGFDKGIHNILEAAVFEIPLLIGPRNDKFQEAKDLLSQQGAFLVQHESDILEFLRLFVSDIQKSTEAGKHCIDYVNNKKGAVSIIIQYMKQHEII